MSRYLVVILELLILTCLVGAAVTSQAPAKAKPAQVAPTPIVAAMLDADGMELVITPLAEKLAPLGLKPENLRPLADRRFVKGEWKVKVKDREIQLDQVARLELRKLLAPPFPVALPDGRQAVIAPRADRIARYLVPGRYFEEAVREALAGLFVEDPGKVIVLGGIRVPGGQIPNYWGSDHVHVSLGEPIERFAEVKIRGARGPQAADLDRMRALRRLVEQAVAAEKSTPRARFEARFGKVQEHKAHGWVYSFGKSRVQLWFAGDPPVVRTIFYNEGEPAAAEGVAAKARAIAQVDRDFLLAFLARKYGGAGPQEKELLRAFLDATAAVVNWTAQERKQLLGQPR